MAVPRPFSRWRAVLRHSTRQLVGQLWRGGRLVSRPLRRRRDQARAPWTPALIVPGAELDAESVAAAGHERLFIGTNRRYATCTGVVWTRPNRMVVAHKLTRTLVTYAVAASTDGLTIDRLERTPARPEIGQISNLNVSPDGHWLAFGDDTFGHVAVYAVDTSSGGPRESMAGIVRHPGDSVHHGVVFSPDGRHILYSSIDLRAGGLRIAPFAGDPTTGTVTIGEVRAIPNAYRPSALKGLDFSPDGRWLALSYGANAGPTASRSTIPAFVEVHPWDATSGRVGPPVTRSPRSWGMGIGEDITWLASGDRLLVADQSRDQALLARCDPVTGALGPIVARIGWAAGGLQAPHGCAQSPDGRWLAITNYGDGSCRIFDTTDPASGGATSTV